MENPKLPIIVVGAGAVGVATALALRRRGEKVLLLEQFFIGHQRGSSHGPSRIIRYLYEVERYTQMMPSGILRKKYFINLFSLQTLGTARIGAKRQTQHKMRDSQYFLCRSERHLH